MCANHRAGSAEKLARLGVRRAQYAASGPRRKPSAGLVRPTRLPSTFRTARRRSPSPSSATSFTWPTGSPAIIPRCRKSSCTAVRPTFADAACATCPTARDGRRTPRLPACPYAYVVQQLAGFQERSANERRRAQDEHHADDPGRQGMTDDGDQVAADYFSSMKWTPWIRSSRPTRCRRRESPATCSSRSPIGGTEPLGNRIVETPEDAERFELRDPRSGFVAYVPRGSIAKGARAGVERREQDDCPAASATARI